MSKGQRFNLARQETIPIPIPLPTPDEKKEQIGVGIGIGIGIETWYDRLCLRPETSVSRPCERVHSLTL
ncbi:MAG TPA: hypothetical protein VEJ88_01440 [Dissulfurispiraceae bacterium]|nr:hypothetical protein [Dissulfurispiraceae bacterium]